jgi:hypothetical protein
MKRKRLGLFAGMKSSSGERWTLALWRKPGAARSHERPFT